MRTKKKALPKGKAEEKGKPRRFLEQVAREVLAVDPDDVYARGNVVRKGVDGATQLGQLERTAVDTRKGDLHETGTGTGQIQGQDDLIALDSGTLEAGAAAMEADACIVILRGNANHILDPSFNQSRGPDVDLVGGQRRHLVIVAIIIAGRGFAGPLAEQDDGLLGITGDHQSGPDFHGIPAQGIVAFVFRRVKMPVVFFGIPVGGMVSRL
jgi:hypothetical protein